MKQIKIISLLLIILLVTGCKDNSVVSKENKEATEITNPVTETVKKESNALNYEFNTSTSKINVELTYNDSYKQNGKYLESTWYKVTAYVEDYTLEYFGSIKDATEEENILNIGGYETIKMMTDIKVMYLVNVDAETIVYIVADSEGRCMAEEIRDDKNFQELISNMKITVKKK